MFDRKTVHQLPEKRASLACISLAQLFGEVNETEVCYWLVPDVDVGVVVCGGIWWLGCKHCQTVWNQLRPTYSNGCNARGRHFHGSNRLCAWLPMTDDRQPSYRGSFSIAQPSPRYTLTCAIPACQRKHDGTNSRLWIKGTRLMMCAACAEAREMRRISLTKEFVND